MHLMFPIINIIRIHDNIYISICIYLLFLWRVLVSVFPIFAGEGKTKMKTINTSSRKRERERE